MKTNRILLITAVAAICLAAAAAVILSKDHTPDHIDAVALSEGEYEVIGKMMFDRYFYLLGHPGSRSRRG